LAAKADHPCFQAPPDRDTKIWRYMDFPKYAALLEARALFFSRADQLGDPYEGATSHAGAALRPALYATSEIPTKVLTWRSKFAEWVRQWTFVNCWHMNPFESDAMWKLYAQAGAAIAIQSTFTRLYQCLPSEAYVGVVRYIDYETEWLPDGNSFWAFVHKRRAFEHERELRAVIQELPERPDGIAVGSPNTEAGRLIPVDMAYLVERVFVSPTAADWIAELVRRITARYGFPFEIAQSSLSKAPEF